MMAYRLEKADVALEDAAFLTDAARYDLAASRLVLCIVLYRICIVA